MISGEVMPVIGKWLNYMSRLHDGVDAILIADRHGTIEYSAMFSEQEKMCIRDSLPGGEAGQVHRTTADVRASVQNTGSLPAH